MPRNLTPEDRWETDFQVPIPGEPRNIGPLETLFQRLLNRTERLKNRLGAILGLPWDATPPDTLAGLAGRVSTLETNQGSTTLSAHRSAATLDHPDRSVTAAKLSDGAVTTPKIANQAVTADKLAPGSVVGHLGYTPVNKAGDTMTGPLKINNERLLHVYVDHDNANETRYYYLGRIFNNAGIFKISGILGGHAIIHGRANIDLQLAFRDGFRADGYIMGTVNRADLLVKDGSDGWAYVYLITKPWALVNIELSTVVAAEIYYNGTYSITAPGGTTIYLLSSDFDNNTHPNTLKLNDGVLQARYDHQNQFVLQGSPRGITLPANSGEIYSSVSVFVPFQKIVYLKRVRWFLASQLRPQISSLAGFGWTGSSGEGDIAMNFALSSVAHSNSLIVISLVVLNITQYNIMVPSSGIWAELEIR